MKSLLLGVVAACLIAAFFVPTELFANGDEFAPGEVLIRYKADTSGPAITGFENENELVLLNNLTRLKVRHYKLPDTLSVQDAIKQFSTSPIVELAEPNLYRRLNAIPSDPRFGEQWALHNTGQSVNGFTGPADVDIDWPEAMDLFQPNGEVIVAVIDSGVALDHPEINLNSWLNPGEINYSNGVDDDGNGYIDDRGGWDFSDNDNLPLDENGHGTLVASVIGASINNGEGGTGVAPNVKIMALRVLDQLGGLDGGLIGVITFILATDYAANHGARIINYSIGGGSPSTFERDQIQWLDAQGILFVTSAGNGGSDFLGDNNDASPNYPSSYPVDNIIAVAAVDRSGDLADFSNFGLTSVDLAAPGTDIFGADVTRLDVFTEDFEFGAPGWSQSSNTGLIWSLYTDSFSNTWLTDSIDPTFSTPVNYLPFTDSWAMPPPIDLRSGVGQRLTYDIVYEFEFFFDGLTIEVSTDNGATWTTERVHTWIGASLGEGRREVIDLSGYAGQIIQLRFRLLADGTNEFDGAYIDNITVSQFGVFSYDGTQYQHDRGTSFSAPLVSGVAAMIMAQRPDLTHRQVRQIILDNVDMTTGLTGKVMTGGRLNARSALISAIAQPVQSTVIGAAVLPASRSVQVGNTATAFATIVNAGSVQATSCGIAPFTTVAANFSYQITNPLTNALIGSPNNPVDIPAGTSQSFIFSVTPTAPFTSTEIQLDFDCSNTNSATVIPGVNTLLLSASSGPVADIVALAVTPTGDGIVKLPGSFGINAFAVATVNVGSQGSITATPDTGNVNLPVGLTICETNPATGGCLSAPASSVTTTINAGATPTFAIFVTGNGFVPFDPASNRIFVRFKDDAGVTRGATSVAAQTL